MTDPITFQVVSSSLAGIAREMQASLFRTGFSTIIRESLDASCAITDPAGRVVGQHVVLPLHMGAFPACVESVLREYPDHALHPGDAFLINHPYHGGSPHAPDMAVITPAFFQGKLVGFCCNMAHKSDLGGSVPGSASGRATEIYHEGLHLPAVRYLREGVVSREIERLIIANSRTPDLVVGDIRGQVGTNHLGTRRLQAFMAKYGRETVTACYEEICRKTEERVRAHLSRWPDGEYEEEGYLDNDGLDLGRPVRLHVRVGKEGSKILFDFTGCDPQTRGPANIRPPLVRACCYYALISMMDKTLPYNSGLDNAVETRFAPRTVLNPDPPAPVNTYAPTAQMAIEITLRALSNLVPDRAIGESGGGGGITLGSTDLRTGRPYVQYELTGSGMGARVGKDGVNAVGVHMANCAITPIEIVETEFPVRVRRFELIPDSGGPGQYRGGLGFVREYAVLQGARFSYRGDRHVIAPRGARGGWSGRPGAIIVNPGTPGQERLPSRLGDYILKAGDILRIEKAGGGGLGDPRLRDLTGVAEDVENGYITPEAARRAYGTDL